METASVLGSSQGPSLPLEFRSVPPEKYGAFLGNERVQIRMLAGKNLWEVPEGRLSKTVPPIIVAIGRAVGERANRELAWLSKNRHLYANRWIALDGDTLLAVGNSAREVYAATAGYDGTPLVIQVEPLEEANFAGW